MKSALDDLPHALPAKLCPPPKGCLRVLVGDERKRRAVQRRDPDGSADSSRGGRARPDRSEWESKGRRPRLPPVAGTGRGAWRVTPESGIGPPCRSISGSCSPQATAPNTTSPARPVEPCSGVAASNVRARRRRRSCRSVTAVCHRIASLPSARPACVRRQWTLLPAASPGTPSSQTACSHSVAQSASLRSKFASKVSHMVS